MAISKIDFISPKITLYYKGRNSHISLIGGFLSICFLILIFLVFFSIIWNILISPQIISSFAYEQNLSKKILQPISYSGINHFIQLYSYTNNTWFGDLDNKNILVYSIKENQTSSFNNININLENTDHWLYDKCEKVFEENKNFFLRISNNILNFSKSICLRFYYNSKKKEYIEIGLDGYVSPYLETNQFYEKQNIYRIIIEKCINNTFINNKMGYICNNEKEINNYIKKFSDVFTFFVNNQLIPDNYKSPFEKYYYSVSSPLNINSYFQNNIIFSPIKLITDKPFLSKSNKEELSFILNNHYSNNVILNNEKTNILGIFNFYLDNNVIIYHRLYLHLLEAFSHMGGIAQILFFFLQILNYINHHYITLEHIKNLFQINTGIELNTNNNNSEGKDLFIEKRNLTNHNYIIKVFNNNIKKNTEDINNKLLKNYYAKTQDTHSKNNPFDQSSGKKNKSQINKNRELFLSKRSKTKYNTNNINEISMEKQLVMRRKEKRKSFLSQGFFSHQKRYSNKSRNQSNYENDLSNNEIISSNDKSNILSFKDVTLKNNSPQRTSHELILLKNKKEKRKSKKFLQKKSFADNNERINYLLTKNLHSNNGRHKSVHVINDRNISDNNNSLNNRFLLVKNSSGYINDSTKAILVNNKSPFMLFNNKYQLESKYDNNSRKPSLNINNEFSNKNIPNVSNNSYVNPSIFLKNLIHTKIKFYFPEDKKAQNILTNSEKKINYFDFFKSLFVFKLQNQNKLWLLNDFRIRLLSEEHIYKVFINLYLIEKIFQIDDNLTFDINELYNNL